jgi:hypothetical protein
MMQANPHPSPAKRDWLRIPLMALSIGALTAGLWAGLLRIGWQIPPISTRLLIEHGPLMVAGFLGTLISLERAVALSQLQHGRRVYFLAPMLAGLGSVALFLPVPPFVPRLLITLAALRFFIIFILIYRLQPSTHNAVMSLGVLLWLLGNGLWLAGLPVSRVVPWWAGFLVLTIAGERLELARMLILTKAIRMLFFAITGIVLAGLLISLALNDFGLRITGFGLAALGIWLLRFDIARRTIRQQALTRYIAACLLPGYAWLALGGLLWMVYGGRYPAGPIYDAMLHTIFIGFVFSMIFGHAPVIIPAVMGMPIRYLSIFYFHLSLLHISLALRIAGDLLFLQSIRRWGGLLNEVAVILFLLVTVIAARRGVRINNKSDTIRKG